MREIFERRSVRRFNDRQIEHDVINRIVAAGMQAPTALNQQEYEFIIVDDKAILNKLANCTRWSQPMGRANVGIVVLANKNRIVDERFWQQDLGAVTQNILLEAKHYGIGSCWMGIAPCEDKMNNVREILGIDQNIYPFNLIALGYPLEESKTEDRFDQTRIHYNKY